MAMLRWTSRDLDRLPKVDGTRYEVMDGELYVSTQPHWAHQLVCSHIITLLNDWSRATESGIANLAPGLIFAEDDDVAPDVVWISRGRLSTALHPDGKLHATPELVVEVLSPGPANERRDREIKLNLYSRHGVLEYWIVDWRERSVEVYQRVDSALTLVQTLHGNDVIQSVNLPGFTCEVDQFFVDTKK